MTELEWERIHPPWRGFQMNLDSNSPLTSSQTSNSPGWLKCCCRGGSSWSQPWVPPSDTCRAVLEYFLPPFMIVELMKPLTTHRTHCCCCLPQLWRQFNTQTYKQGECEAQIYDVKYPFKNLPSSQLRITCHTDVLVKSCMEEELQQHPHPPDSTLAIQPAFIAQLIHRPTRWWGRETLWKVSCQLGSLLS